MTKSNLIQLFSPALKGQSLHKNLGEEFQLCENGSMIFHWADFYETCDQVKTSMDKDEELRKDFARLEAKLQRLALIPVWIKTTGKIYQTTMYALYEKHILRLSHHMEGLDFYGPMEVSLISGTGPFKTMAVSEFFHRETYQQFILVNLLKGKLPKRDYRIRLKAKILMEYGDNFENSTLVHLDQLTTKGLLLNLPADLYLRGISRSTSARILIDTGLLKTGTGKNLNDLQTHLAQHLFNLLYSSRREDSMELDLKDVYASSSFEFLRNQQKFLFVPYEVLRPHSPDAVFSMIDFVQHTRELVRGFYAKSEESAA